jgi:hypothetical protein
MGAERGVVQVWKILPIRGDNCTVSVHAGGCTGMNDAYEGDGKNKACHRSQ